MRYSESTLEATGGCTLSAARKLLALFNRRERRQLYLLLASMTVFALIEVAGIVSILPFLAVVSAPEIVEQNPVFHWLYEFLGFKSVNRFLLLLGGGVFLILVFSNGFSALLSWAMLRYTWMRNYSLSQRLLASYLSRPYAFFLNRNSADLAKNILAEVNQFITGYMIPGLRMVSSGVVALFILAVLIAIKPMMALVISLVLGGSYGLFYGFTRKKLRLLGKGRFEANQRRFNATKEVFDGIKFVKLLGAERLMLQQYSAPAYQFSRSSATGQVIGQLPRYALEVVAFGGILLIVLYLLAIGDGLSQVLPLIGLYAFAGYRLMPALQTIFHSVAEMRFNAPVVERLCEELGEARQADAWFGRHTGQAKIEPLPFRNLLELNCITFQYPGAPRPVIHNLSLSIVAHTSVAFVGTTGAGKTTIVDLILGLLRPNLGQICVDGVVVGEHNLACWQVNLGYVPQDIYLLDSTVAENIAFGEPKKQIDLERVVWAARIAHIHQFVTSELPAGYDTPIGERGVRLSGGQRQRIGIARALYRNPTVLVLDEATSALDGPTEHAVLEAIYRLSEVKTLIFIAHRLTTIRGCDVIYLLDKGDIVASGSYDELMASQEQFRRMAQTRSS